MNISVRDLTVIRATVIYESSFIPVRVFLVFSFSNHSDTQPLVLYLLKSLFLYTGDKIRFQIEDICG